MTTPDQSAAPGENDSAAGPAGSSNAAPNRAREVATAVGALLIVVILVLVAALVRQGRQIPEPTEPPVASASPTPSPSPTEPAIPPVVEVWSTSMDRQFATTTGSWVSVPGQEGSDGGTEPDDAQPDGTIVVDGDHPRQSFNAVGAALTHSSAAVLAAMPEEERTALLEELFAPDGPVRLGVLRIPFGGSDFVAEPAYTYDDLPAGETDWDLQRFSTDADAVTLRPILRQILGIAPKLQIIASPWSPPAWLKDSGRLDGGRLLDDDRAVDTYANYLAKAVEEYAGEDIPITAITVQNEPQARTPDGYPGTDMPVADEAAVISALGPALASAGLSTQILAYDHNWSLHPADAASTRQGDDPEYEYPSDVLRSDAAAWVAGVAYHCYSGDASRMSELHDAFPDAAVWVTECSGSHQADDTAEQIFSNTLSWQAQNLMIASLNNWAGSVLTWNLALDENGGPHIGGCDTCTGVVTVASDGTVTRNAEYYALAGVGRFAAAGAVVVGDGSGSEAGAGSTGDAGSGTDSASGAGSTTDLPHVALLNPDGSAVVLVFNGSDEERTIDIEISNEDVAASNGSAADATEDPAPNASDSGTTGGDRIARATIPARALATVVIPNYPAQ